MPEADAPEALIAEARSATPHTMQTHQVEMLLDRLALALENLVAVERERDSARNVAVALENEVARLKAENERLIEQANRNQAADRKLLAAATARSDVALDSENSIHPNDCECYPCWQRSEAR